MGRVAGFSCAGFLAATTRTTRVWVGVWLVFLSQLMFRNGVGGEDARKGCIVGVHIRKTTISVPYRG